jgi:hypothetical protein
LAVVGITAQVADRITAASLRGIVSFLASDALAGRDTPSEGLEVAATYIASEFRRAGLESPAGPDYSQYADFAEVSDNGESLQFSMTGAGEPPRTSPSARISVHSLEAAHVMNEPVFKWAPSVKIAGTLEGKVLMLRATSDESTLAKLEQSHPDAIVELSRNITGSGWRKGRLFATHHGADVPTISVPAGDVESIFDRLPNGDTTAHVSLNIGAPLVKPIHLRNVIGILSGSDARLRDQYILVSAHYDHLGAGPGGIFSGANDDASGVAAVIALANAFSRTPHPARTLVFVAFFGEEKGLLGSNWFVRHPIVPLAQIVADVNFEQLGEVADEEGLPAAAVGVTGYDLSDLPKLMAPALISAGVKLRDTRDNLSYFSRSDNFPLAEAGIPSHTFVTAYEYPDYHRVTDKWPKLNYENMARITSALGSAIRSLADGPDLPHWVESSKTKGYIDAWRAMHR